MPGLPRKLATHRSAAAVLVAALCLAYAGHAGHGFIKDDFRWIRETRASSLSDVARLFQRSDGFYRPLVSLSFSLNSTLAGVQPRAYGWTNLLLVAACAFLVYRVAVALELSAPAALVAGGAWAFNFHGINMAVLWISGRTALLVTLFALATAIAAVSRRWAVAGVCCFLALLSKEEAVLLPLVVFLWAAYDVTGSIAERVITAGRRALPCFAALGVYLALRLQTNAFWPAGAPDYYRFTQSVLVVGANIFQYADRSMTWPAFVALILFLAAKRQPRVDERERRVVAFGAIWLVCLFGLTVFVPVRSSLYSVLPSVGSALAAGAVASGAQRAEPKRVAAAMTALVLLPLLLLPIYWRRNERWVRLADLSSNALQQVAEVVERDPGRRVVLVDDPSERFNLDAAFGSLWPDAAALCLPSGAVADITSDGTIARDAIILRLRDGRLMKEN